MSDDEETDDRSIKAVRIRRRVESEDVNSDEQDKLKKDHFMKADSDQIDLDVLLQAVLDISDRLHEQENKLEKQVSARKRRPRSSFASSSNFKNLDNDMDDGLSFASDLNSPGRVNRTSRRPSSAISQGRANEKKNLSFANDKVDEIDRENQRLLKKILRHKAKNSGGEGRTAGPIRVKSAAEVNRSKFQKQVEQENMALLRRLESVKPTKSLSRDHLLRDHFKQTEYAKIVSRSGSRPSATSMRNKRSSSMSNLSDVDGRSEISVQSRASVNSARSQRSKRSSSQASLRGSRMPVNALWEPGW